MKNKSLSIYDISKELNLSPATISRVMNHPDQVKKETRDRVLAYIQQIDFQKRYYSTSRRPEKPEGGIGSYSSAFLISIPSASNPFYADVIEGIMTAAAQHSCRVYANYTLITEKTIDSFLSTIVGSFRGMVSLQPLTERLLRIIASQIPVLQCSEAAPRFSDVSSITIDNVQAEKKAVKYLLSLGCRSFSFFTSMEPFRFSEERLRGLRLALEEASLSLPGDQIVRVSSMEYQSAYDAAIVHLKKTHPDAIVCISDVFAAACINAAHSLSIRIPEDMMVIGFDNISVSMVTTPAITTIAQPRFQLGFQAFETLYQEATSPQVKKTTMFLETQLLVRGSTDASFHPASEEPASL